MMVVGSYADKLYFYENDGDLFTKKDEEKTYKDIEAVDIADDGEWVFSVCRQPSTDSSLHKYNESTSLL